MAEVKAETGGRRVKVGALISGRGSNLQALIDAAADPDYPAEIALVISNVADVYGLERARQAGIATATVPHGDFANRRDFEDAIAERLLAAGCEIVCLAGFMRVLTADFVKRWPNRMLNIHPSLLPAFKGLHTQKRALEAGVTLAGCTVHIVTPDLDDGPIIVQAAVPVLPDDTEGTLSARILAREHRIYPAALGWLASGRLRIEGHRALLDDAGELAGTELVVPSA
jgi:phosphoribosylglycinamide formyltransferase-1